MEFTVTAWPVVITAENVHRSINDLGVLKHVRGALERVKRLAEPRKVPAGRHTAILEPRAVAQLLRPLLDAADVRAYHNGDSALCGKLGEAIVDTRLTLRNRPDHPDLLGKGFDAIGLASNARTWIERGVLTQIHYDRLTARDYGTPPTYVPDAPHLSGIGPASESVDELIRATKHGILVTDLGDPVCAESTDLTLTGATAGGLFLIEDGQIVAGVEAMRWSDSPLRAFNEVESYTVPLEAPVRPADGGGPVTAGLRKMLVPAMVVRDFNFSSAARS
jgi:predicted Zn-dependent protease